MNADGTIYHTLGGRDGTDALSHLAMPAFVRVLNETLFDHEAYAVAPPPPQSAAEAHDRDSSRSKAKNPNTPKCFHCHMVFDFDQQAAEKERRWKRSDAFRWPDPIQIGLRLDRDAQNKVASVVPGVSRGEGRDQTGRGDPQRGQPPCAYVRGRPAGAAEHDAESDETQADDAAW